MSEVITVVLTLSDGSAFNLSCDNLSAYSVDMLRRLAIVHVEVSVEPVRPRREVLQSHSVGR